MNVRTTVALSLVSLFWLNSTAQAQPGTAYLSEDPTSVESSGSVYGVTPLGVQGSRAWVRADVGERPGNVGSFYSVGGFMPIQLFGPEMAFYIDAQGWVNENGDPGVDFGGGYRQMIDAFNSIIGINTFVTHDQSLNERTHRRYGFGGEWLTEFLTVTGNYYIPIDSDVFNVGNVVQTNDAFFQGNNLFIRNFQRGEVQLKGGDVEVGFTVPQATWLSLYAGGYFFRGNGAQDVNGFQGRAQFDFNSVVVEVSATKDSVFGNTFNGAVQYVLGPGIPQFQPRERDFYTRIYDSVSHRRRAVLQDTIAQVNEAAINPATGLPYTFTHIDNTFGNAGTGTFEDRYNNLDDANGDGNEFVLIHRGNTTIGNLLQGQTGLILEDDQVVLGEGTFYELTVANRPALLPLPGFATPGGNPFITADANRDVITLANNNQVIGLNIITPNGGDAIAGTGIQNFDIQDINRNLAAASSGPGGGIVLQNASGIGRINNVGFRSAAGSPGGILIDNINTAPLNLFVDDVTFLAGGQVGVRLTGDNSDINATLSDIAGNANGRGMDIAASNGGDVSVSVSDSTFTNTTTDHGLVVRSTTTGVAQLVGNNVNVFNADDHALLVDANNGTARANLTNSNLSSAGQNAVSVVGTGATGVANVQITGSNGNDAGASAVAINLSNDATGVVNLVNSSFDNAVGSAVTTSANDATATITVNNTSLFSAGTDAFAVNATNAAQVTGSLLGNVNMNDAASNAISLTSASDADISVTGTGAGIRGANAVQDAIVLSSDGAGSNTILSLTDPGTFANAGFGGVNTGSGINLQGNNAGNIALTITGNPTADALFSNASRDGVEIDLDNAATALVDLSFIDLSSAGSDAFSAIVDNNSALNIVDLSEADLRDAVENGLILQARTGGQITGTLDSVQLDNAGIDAMTLISSQGGDIAITGDEISGASAGNGGGGDRDGIDVRAIDAGSTTQLTLTNTGSFAGADDDALDILTSAGGVASVNIQGGNFNTAGNDGVQVLAGTNGLVNLTLDGSTFFDAGANGMNLSITDGARVTGNITNGNFASAGTNAFLANLNNAGGAANASTINFLTSDLSQAAEDSFNAIATNNSVLTLHTTNSNISNPGQQIHDYTVAGVGSAITNLVDPTDARGAGGDAIRANVSNGGVLNITHIDSDLGTSALATENIGGNGVAATLTTQGVFNLTLTNSDMNFANGDGLNVTADNAAFNMNVTNSAISNATGDGLDISLQNGSTGQFVFSNFNVDGNNGSGLRLSASNSTVNNSTFTDGTFNDNGVAGVDNSAGISITSLNGANIGTRALTPGMTFTRVQSSNTVDNARTQDDGLQFRADNGGYLGLLFNDSDLMQNEGDGVDGIVNQDLSLTDNALAFVRFENGSRINDNFNDGVFLRAFNGSDVAVNPNNHTSGIIFTVQDSAIQQNGDGPPVGGFLGNPPQSGANGNGIGFGINAFADGDNSVAGNTQITLNIINSDLTNNEEGALNPVQQDGGVINLNQVGGVFDLHHFQANGPLDVVSIALDNVTLTPNANGPGFSLWSRNNGLILADFNNLDISNNGGVGIVTLAETGGDIDLTLRNSIVRSNGNLTDNDIIPDTNLLAIAAIQSIIDGVGSNTDLTLDNVDILDHAALNAFEAVVGFRPDAAYAADPSLAATAGGTGAGTFTGTFTDVVSNNNVELGTEGSLQVRADGAAAVANLDIDTYTNELANGSGVNLVGTTGGTLNVTQFDNITLTNNTTDGVNVDVDSIQNFVANNVTVTGAGGVGVDINAAAITGGLATVTLNNVTANNAAQGLDLTLNGTNGTDVMNVNINNGTFNNATAGPAVNILLNGVDGSTATMNVNGLTANSSAGNGIVVAATGGLDLAVPNFDNVSATNAIGTGLLVTQAAANGNLTQFDMTTGNFNGSGNGVIIATTNSNAAANISLTDVTANGPPAGIGVQVTANGLGGVSSVDLTNVDAISRGVGGQIVTAASVPGAQTIVTVDGGSDFSTSTGTGLIVNQSGAGTTGNINVSNTTIDNSANPLILQQSGLTGGASTISLSNVSAQNSTAGDGATIQAIGLGATDSVAINVTNSNLFNAFEDGLDIDVNGAVGSTAVVNIVGGGGTINVDSAGQDGINISGTGGVATSITGLNDISAQNAGDDGVEISSVGGTISQITGTNINATGATDEGVRVFIQNQAATTAINLSNVNVANTTNGDALHIELDNVGAGNPNTIALNNITATNAGGDGVELTLNNNTTASVTAFNNVTANLNDINGLSFNVLNGSDLTSLSATGWDLSNNSLNNINGAGLNVQVTGGSTADFDLSALTINNNQANFGKGVNINVQGAGSLLGFDITGAASVINNTGREGIDIEVGTAVAGATFNSNFANLDVTGAGSAPSTPNINGIDVDVTGAGSAATMTFNNVSSDNNNTAPVGDVDGDGYNFNVNAGATLSATLSNGSTGSGNRGEGLSLTGDGAGTNVSLLSQNVIGQPVNTFNNNGSHGVNVLLTPGTNVNPLVANFDLTASANNNGGDGIRLIANGDVGGLSGITINNLGITANNVNVDNNQGNGLTIDLNRVAGINSFSLDNMQVNDNVGDQINVAFRNMTLQTVSFNNVNADGPGALVGTGDGLELTLDNTNVTAALNLENVTAVNNGEDGLQLTLRNLASIPAGSRINEGIFDNNGQHGINLAIDNATADLDITNADFLLNSVASASNNGARVGGAGINIQLDNAATLTGDIDHITINANNIVGATGGEGIRVQTAVSNYTGDIFDNTISNNESFGIRGRFLNSTMNLDLRDGDLVGVGNRIDSNRDAGIAIDMLQNTVGQISVTDNVITGTVNGQDAAFNGDAFMLRMLGTLDPAPALNFLNATGTGNNDSIANDLPGLLISNNFIGEDELGNADANNGMGITFDLQERSSIDGVHILNNVISNSLTADGINFRRFDEVVLNDFLIDENLIENNADDGIEIVGENDDNSLLMVTIGQDGQQNGAGGLINTDAQVRNQANIFNWLNAQDGNVIMGNGNDGIALQVNADSNLMVNIQENSIIDNGSDGIQVIEIIQDPSDQRNVTGTWNQNMISNNSSRGIRVAAANSFINITDSFVGAVTDQFNNILFDGNGSTGVEITGATNTMFISNLDVIRNGRLAGADRTQGHGFDFQNDQVGQSITLQNSLVRDNFRDGIEILTDFAFGVYNFTDNRVVSNDGRGYDILTRDDGRATINIIGSVDPRINQPTASASSNEEEGIYVVNTAFEAQNQSDLSNVFLGSTGSTTDSSQTSIVINQVDASNNGNTVLATLPDALAGAGIVMRVGTNAGNYGLIGAGNTDQNGFFASDGVGGVLAQITSNTLQGNFGDDVFIHSFRSANAPATITGAWDATNFTPNTTGRGDPLARIDLVWGVLGQVNQFDSIDMFNVFDLGVEPQNAEPGAYYDDADAVFKSRVVNNTTPAEGGPFQAGDRRRNATRLAQRVSRAGQALGPSVTPNPSASANPFLYPGMGDSTFRARASSGNNLDLVLTANGFESQPFFFDDDPRLGGDFIMDTFGDAGGNFFDPGVIFGEQPFGWGTF